MIQAIGQGASRVWAALFGIATRRAFVDYARMIVIIQFILLAIAWTIDLAKAFPELRDAATARDQSFWAIAAPYMGYRTADMVTRLLPMACFFGAFMAEIRRRLTLEAVILNAAGASPTQLMIGALWLGALLGAGMQMMEAKWRPDAVWAQVRLDVGDYARRFHRSWVDEPQWILLDDMAIRGEILRQDPPMMRDVLIFSGTSAAQLEKVYSAQQMVPGPSVTEWDLKGVTAWERGDPDGVAQADVTLRFDMIPEMLTYYDVLEFNLPTAALQAYQVLPGKVPRPGIETAIWRRRTTWALPGALIILGGALARAGFDGRRMVVARLIALAAVGYVLVVSIKVFWKLGEHDALNAAVAASAGAVLSLLGAWVVPRLPGFRSL